MELFILITFVITFPICILGLLTTLSIFDMNTLHLFLLLNDSKASQWLLLMMWAFQTWFWFSKWGVI